MVGKVESSPTFPDHYDRVADRWQTVADHMETRLNTRETSRHSKNSSHEKMSGYRFYAFMKKYYIVTQANAKQCNLPLSFPFSTIKVMIMARFRLERFSFKE